MMKQDYFLTFGYEYAMNRGSANALITINKPVVKSVLWWFKAAQVYSFSIDKNTFDFIKILS